MSALARDVSTAPDPPPAGHQVVTGRPVNPWVRFLLRRLAGLMLAGAILVVLTFLIVPLIPGDPARAVAGTNATPATVNTIREQLGLNESMPAQFGQYVTGLPKGDLGTSFRYRVPVSDVVLTRLPYTAQIALPAILVVLLLAIPLGMTVGVLTRGGRRRWLDLLFGTVAGTVAAMPAYVLGTLLIVVVAIQLGLLPPGGADSVSSLVLPILALSLGPAFAVARVVRQETVTVLEQEFMRTARGHRLSAVRLYLQHGLPNLLTSVLTLTGLVLTSLLGGTVIIENVFSYPGLGTEVVQAIIYKDYPVIQGLILTIGALALAVNLIVDVVLGLVDPRSLQAVRHDG